MKVGRVTGYPWYQELGLLGSLIIVFTVALNWSALPEAMPMHYFFRGVAPFYAPPLAFVLFALIFNGALWFVDALLRYSWLCAETKKRFNWLQLISLPLVLWVAPTVTFLAVYSVTAENCEGLSCMKGSSYPPALVGAAILLAEAYLVATELFRRKHAIVESDKINISGQMELAESLLDSPTFCVYQRVHSWTYSILIAAALLTVLGVTLVFAPGPEPKILVLVVVLPGFAICIGGATYVLTQDAFSISIGVLPIRLRKIRLQEIVSVSAFEKAWPHVTAPFANGKLLIKAIVSRGPVVKVDTKRFSYILSSPNAPALAALILKARERALKEVGK